MNRTIFWCLGLVPLALAAGCSEQLGTVESGPSGGGGVQVANLRCEYLSEPLAIDSPRPRLSWVLESSRRGVRQVAYQIRAASSPRTLQREPDLWDSGRVESPAQNQIEWAGPSLGSGQEVYWQVRVWTEGQPGPSAWSTVGRFRMGLLEPGDWKAKWIGVPVELPETKPYPPQPAMQVRKDFELKGPVRRAIAHVSALGLYELRLNGRRVGDHILAPEWTNYHKRIQYQAYDVTELLYNGANAVGATVAEGWYAGKIGISFIQGQDDPRRGHYGRRLRLLAQIEVEYRDGTKELIVTDESWKGTTEGPVRVADLLDGETYDARREMPGWDRPGFAADKWVAVDVGDEAKGVLTAQPNEPIRVTERLRPIWMTEPSPGVYVVDFGQVIAGRCRLRVRGEPGQEIELRHVEVLKEDGNIYRDNLRINANGPQTGARQKDVYICRGGGQEEYAPEFTYHGFRYVEVRGLKSRPPADFIVAEAFHSAPDRAGAFASSSELLNKLMSNIVWTLRDNLHSTPTDCPQRDERMGWMGDMAVFAQPACYLMDMGAFFSKWVRDIRDDQADDGRYADFVPHPFNPNARFSGAPAWGDCGVIVPWRMYQNYGDTRVLAEHFESARRWVDFIHKNNPDLVWRKARGNDYNDWLNGDTLKLEGYPKGEAEIPREVFATAFFHESTEMVAKMARVLGRTDDAEKYGKLAEDIRAAFIKNFVKEDGEVTGNTQSAYAIAFEFGLLPDEARAAAAKRMVQRIRDYKNHISTGFHTTVMLMKQLTATGNTPVAYMLINNRTIPSWGYTIDQGGTTIWERWDGYVEGRGFQDPGMNSFCHYAIGSVGEWMYRTILGINPDESRPGYEHIILRPEPGGGLTWARGHHDTIRGRISSDWRVDGDRFTLKVQIPANTTATLYLPAADAAAVTEGDRPAAESPGVTPAGSQGATAVFELGSGAYTFQSTLPRSE